MGRHTKLTLELQEIILKHIEAGNYAKDACHAVGISEKTYYEWLKRGEESQRSTNRFGKFSKSIKEAHAKAIIRNVTVVNKAAKDGDWKAAMTWLERTNPQDWGKKEYLSQDINMKSLPPAEIIFEVVDAKTSKDKGNKGIRKDISE